MIKRSFITALVLLLVYHFLLPHLPRNYYWIAGQQRANYLRAQHYVQDAPADANVIVGSSMANQLSDELLGEKLTKLTFPAGGSLTGLEMIRATEKHPKVLWIEINSALRNADQTMLDDVLSPWHRKLRSASAVFKEEGRPSNYAVGFLNAWVGRVGHGIATLANGGKSSDPASSEDAPIESTVFANVMRINREHLDRKPSAEMVTRRANQLGELVDEFTRFGTKCILFEMPIDSTLRDLAEPAGVRQAMVDRFPFDKYDWIQFDHSHAYQTSDGIHLVKAEADALTIQMLDDSRMAR